jgi:hypothetical protein
MVFARTGPFTSRRRGATSSKLDMPGCARRHRGLLGSGNDFSLSSSCVSSRIPSSIRNGFAFDELISVTIKLLHQIRLLVKPGTLPAPNLTSGRLLKPTYDRWTRQLNI